MSDFDVTGLYNEGTRFFTVPSGAKVPVINNRIETEIVIGLNDAVDRDLEGFLDFVSEQACGSELLMGFSYYVTGLTPEGGLILKVEGDVSEIIKWEDEDNG